MAFYKYADAGHGLKEVPFYKECRWSRQNFLPNTKKISLNTLRREVRNHLNTLYLRMFPDLQCKIMVAINWEQTSLEC